MGFVGQVEAKGVRGKKQGERKITPGCARPFLLTPVSLLLAHKKRHKGNCSLQFLLCLYAQSFFAVL